MAYTRPLLRVATFSSSAMVEVSNWEGEEFSSVKLPINAPSSTQFTGRRVLASIQYWDMMPFIEGVVKPFDLEKDILFRFAIFECGDKSMFAMDLHHIISDGTSVSVICNDIALAYDGKELEPEKFSQLDLSVFEEKLEETEEYQKSKNYYDSIFSAVESKSEITEDFAENSEVEDKPNGSFELSTNGKFSVEDVRNFALANQITPYTVFLGAYEYAVAKFTNQSETTVCTVTHGRFDKQLKNTVGMMVRTLPIHANIDEEDTVSDHLKKIRRNIKETVANDWFPFMFLRIFFEVVRNCYISSSIFALRLGNVKPSCRPYF